MNHDHSNGMGRHMLLMLVGCLVPLALIIAIDAFGLSFGPLSLLAPLAIVLLCPAMMFFMMRDMNHAPGEGAAHHHVEALPASAQSRATTDSDGIRAPTATRE